MINPHAVQDALHAYSVKANGGDPILAGRVHGAVNEEGGGADAAAVGRMLASTRTSARTSMRSAQIESGDDHAFPALIDELPTWRDATVETGRDGNPYTHVRLPGDRNGSPGVYHWIIDEGGMINHR